MARIEELFTPHLTMPETLEPILRTHLGQAHIAGTGPEGKTCRECSHWFNRDGNGRLCAAKYQGDGSGTLHLQGARCNRPILNKADRLVPHNADACRLFEQEESPPPASRPDKRFKRRDG